MIKCISACLPPLFLPTLLIFAALLTTVSPASADDKEEKKFEELELPSPTKKNFEVTPKKSSSSSETKRERVVEEEGEEHEDDDDREDDEHEEKHEEKDHSVAHRILWYLPNRFLDLTDIARARVRVGPGVALHGHVTKIVQVGLGSYMTLYAGLPGPRQRRTPRLPVGVEAYSGGALSVAEASFETGYEPEYSPTEVGAGLHFILLGVDVGVDPLELVDLLTGIVGVDIGDDDY